MKIKSTADAPGCMHIRDGIQFKIGSHGLTYRWTGDEWVRSSCTLERLPDGGLALRAAKTKPRVVSDFVLPLSQMKL